MKKSDTNSKLKPIKPGHRFRVSNGLDPATSEKNTHKARLYIFGVNSKVSSTQQRLRGIFASISLEVRKFVVLINFEKNILKNNIKSKYYNSITFFRKSLNCIELLGAKIAEKRNSVLIILGILSPIIYTYLSEKITFFFLPLAVAIITGLREKSNILLPLFFVMSILLASASIGGGVELFKGLSTIVYIAGSFIIINYYRKQDKTTFIKNTNTVNQVLIPAF